jgi:hypothetical protein
MYVKYVFLLKISQAVGSCPFPFLQVTLCIYLEMVSGRMTSMFPCSMHDKAARPAQCSNLSA